LSVAILYGIYELAYKQDKDAKHTKKNLIATIKQTMSGQSGILVIRLFFLPAQYPTIWLPLAMFGITSFFDGGVINFPLFAGLLVGLAIFWMINKAFKLSCDEHEGLYK